MEEGVVEALHRDIQLVTIDDHREIYSSRAERHHVYSDSIESANCAPHCSTVFAYRRAHDGHDSAVSFDRDITERGKIHHQSCEPFTTRGSAVSIPSTSVQISIASAWSAAPSNEAE